MTKRDSYQCSALVGTDSKTSYWTPMWEVKWGGSALDEANRAIRDAKPANNVPQVAIYRNRRFVRYVYAPVKAVACNA